MTTGTTTTRKESDMDTTTLPTVTECKAHAFANYKATNGLVTGGSYVVRFVDGTVATVDIRVEDGAPRLVGSKVIDL